MDNPEVILFIGFLITNENRHQSLLYNDKDLDKATLHLQNLKKDFPEEIWNLKKIEYEFLN